MTTGGLIGVGRQLFLAGEHQAAVRALTGIVGQSVMARRARSRLNVAEGEFCCQGCKLCADDGFCLFKIFSVHVHLNGCMSAVASMEPVDLSCSALTGDVKGDAGRMQLFEERLCFGRLSASEKNRTRLLVYLATGYAVRAGRKRTKPTSAVKAAPLGSWKLRVAGVAVFHRCRLVYRPAVHERVR